jgi:hypothetical protein
MKTDQLIDMLAKRVEPVEPPRWRRRLTLTLLVGFGVALLLTVIGLGVRPDLGAARMPVMMKALFAAAAAAVILPLAVRLMRPGRPLGWRLAAVGLFVLLCAGVVAVALMGAPEERRMDMWLSAERVPWCVVLIPLLAAPTAALLLWMMRAFAPTRLALTGAAIGALSGGLGAMAYAMYCPADSVAFVVTWYSVGIAFCAALGAAIGSRLLRW